MKKIEKQEEHNCNYRHHPFPLILQVERMVCMDLDISGSSIITGGL
jgi:hypothetical protein